MAVRVAFPLPGWACQRGGWSPASCSFQECRKWVERKGGGGLLCCLSPTTHSAFLTHPRLERRGIVTPTYKEPYHEALPVLVSLKEEKRLNGPLRSALAAEGHLACWWVRLGFCSHTLQEETKEVGYITIMFAVAHVLKRPTGWQEGRLSIVKIQSSICLWMARFSFRVFRVFCLRNPLCCWLFFCLSSLGGILTPREASFCICGVASFSHFLLQRGNRLCFC